MYIIHLHTAHYKNKILLSKFAILQDYYIDIVIKSSYMILNCTKRSKYLMIANNAAFNDT